MPPSTSLSPSTSTPPQPAYIFRSHSHPIHALHFFARNHLLASGDSNGTIIIWRMTTRRPLASWKAHEGGVMGIKDWGGEILISHGRDHKLRVWRVGERDLEGVGVGIGSVSRGVNVSGRAEEKGNDSAKQPWLLHSLDVNALNFCAFAICAETGGQAQPQAQAEATPKPVENREDEDDTSPTQASPPVSPPPPILLATPNALDTGTIDIFQLPSEHRLSKIPGPKDTNTGMVMTLRIFHNRQSKLTLTAGYEDGSIAVYVRKPQNTMPVWIWECYVTARPHSQPVLSLDVLPDRSAFITSSADAGIARFAVPVGRVGTCEAQKMVRTGHAGQQDLKVRSDGRLFATAGWNGSVRVYSVGTLRELAVLRWHGEGCYAVEFAGVRGEKGDGDVDGKDREAIGLGNAMERMKRERDAKVHNTHWLVAGSKDGKISLWDVY